MMNLIKAILVPTDFSMPADYAVHYAMKLAKQIFWLCRQLKEKEFGIAYFIKVLQKLPSTMSASLYLQFQLNKF